MTTTPRTENASESDSNLWQLVCQGSASAFEVLVRRYQSLVCSVAYSACGNLALSEDVAQETFWTAWRQRASLEQPDRLRAWLCGIARNLAKNARRKASRPVESAEAQDVLTELSTDEPGPAEEAVSREEESLVWQALERIPEAYREPLILFYREDRSVAEVAGALVLSEDAVKQRLSRGRGCCGSRWPSWSRAVCGAAGRDAGSRVTVMAGLAAHAAGAKTALAGAGAGAGRGRRRPEPPVRVARGSPRNARRPVGRMARHLGPGPGRPHPPRARCDPPRRMAHAAGLRCLHRRLVRVDSTRSPASPAT